MKNIGGIVNGFQLVAKVSKSGVPTMENMPKHLPENQRATFAEAYAKCFTENDGAKPVVIPRTMAEIYAVANGARLNKDLGFGVLDMVIGYCQNYWFSDMDSEDETNFKSGLRKELTTALNVIDFGFSYKAVSNRLVKDILTEIGKQSKDRHSGNRASGVKGAIPLARTVAAKIVEYVAIEAVAIYAEGTSKADSFKSAEEING